jgi:hypothetical protein
MAAATAAEDRVTMMRRASDVLGVTCPIDVVVNAPRLDGGGVTGGFMWGANGKMLKWAYDGQLERALPVGEDPESVKNYLYLGVSYPTLSQAQRLGIGSEKEAALRDALELFCDDVLPRAKFDSLDAELSSPTRQRSASDILGSLTESQRDALRLWPVVRAVADQAMLVGKK